METPVPLPRRELGSVEGLSALAPPHAPGATGTWLGTRGGRLWWWGEGPPRSLGSLGAAVRAVRPGPGTVLVELATERVVWVDEATGQVRAEWTVAAGDELQAVAAGQDHAVVAVVDGGGHPTDRCSRALRVVAGLSPYRGELVALAPGPRLRHSPRAVYAEGAGGGLGRVPLDGGPVTPMSWREIEALVACDPLPGWWIRRDGDSVVVQSPGAPPRVLGPARPAVAACVGPGGHRAFTLDAAGVLSAWDLHDGAELGRAQVEPGGWLAGRGDGVLLATPGGRLWRFEAPPTSPGGGV